MQSPSLLHRFLVKALPSMHATRRQALSDAAVAATQCNQLSLCALGRQLVRHAKPRHSIKCIDRLLSNTHLHAECLDVYRALITPLLVARTNR